MGERVGLADALPSATRRYGRLKICATTARRLSAWPKAALDTESPLLSHDFMKIWARFKAGLLARPSLMALLPLALIGGIVLRRSFHKERSLEERIQDSMGHLPEETPAEVAARTKFQAELLAIEVQALRDRGYSTSKIDEFIKLNWSKPMAAPVAKP